MRVRRFFLAAALAALVDAAPAGAQNLIPNPTFSDLFTLLGWDDVGVASWSEIDAAELPNSGSVRVVRSSSGGTGPISDCIPVEPDTRYRLAASALWIDAESSAEGTVQLRIQFHQEASCAGTFLPLGTGQVATAPDEWQRIETVVDSPAGADAALVSLWAWRESPSGTFVAYFDDVELVAVPEPSGVAVGAVAALALGHRARTRLRRTRVRGQEERVR